MPYRSIEALQSELSKTVFAYSKDARKAAGRALGTLVELITYYLLDSWGLTPYIAIETPLSEFSNPQISHNVEFTLHPLLTEKELDFQTSACALSASCIRKMLGTPMNGSKNCNNQLLSKDFIVKNSCKIRENESAFSIASLLSYDASKDDASKATGKLVFSNLLQTPFAMFECKRVGVEEGMKKGPQTIEKAKQGAYTVFGMISYYCVIFASSMWPCKSLVNSVSQRLTKPHGSCDNLALVNSHSENRIMLPAAFLPCRDSVAAMVKYRDFLNQIPEC